MSESRHPTRRIALFGSSFNPPHKGHLAVLRDLVCSGDFDEIRLVPVFRHPFVKTLASFSDRFAMTALLANEFNSSKIPVLVDAIENELAKNPSYAIDTVTALIKRHPDAVFTLIVGSDVKNDLSKWHRIDDLKRLVAFRFIPRAGVESSPYPNVSSTEIRAKVAHGESAAEETTTDIAAYILKKKLYLE